MSIRLDGGELRVPFTPRRGYDPAPDLAALIDGLHACALAGEGGAEPLIRVVADLLCGPYAALRGGLLLDEPGREDISTEDAIREAFREGGRARTSH